MNCEHKELVDAILESESLGLTEEIDLDSGKWYCPECKTMVNIPAAAFDAARTEATDGTS